MLVGSPVASLVLAAVLWLIGRPAFAEYGLSEGLGLLSVIAAVLLSAYALMASLRFVSLPKLEAREPDRVHKARWLLCLHVASAALLFEEGVRLAEPFWWRCALVPAGFALWIGARLMGRRPARRRGGWRAYREQQLRADSWPDITVTATASMLRASQSAARASISVELGSVR